MARFILERLDGTEFEFDKFKIVKGLENSQYKEILTKVFPLKQRAVDSLLGWAKNSPEVKKVTLFGSAITLNCNVASDLDVVVEYTAGTDNKGKCDCLCKLFDMQIGTCDILDAGQIRIGSDLYNEIQKKGLPVYEQVTE